MSRFEKFVQTLLLYIKVDKSLSIIIYKINLYRKITDRETNNTKLLILFKKQIFIKN